MTRGTLEVLLVCAKHLEDNNLFFDNDPYAILTVASQEKRSKTASEGGKKPEWNETFLFTVTDIATELHIKVMDKDTFTDDDFIGEADISLEPVLAQGNVPPTYYNLVRKSKFRGEIKVAMTFHPENGGYGGGCNGGGYGERSCGGGYEEEYEEERCNGGGDYGGYRESSRYY